jgi:NAD(P)-dependent dehydrogenase (short-subunit alcohol dehydrogenase family)
MGYRTFLITGASSGLGRAAARRALEAGHTVAGIVRSEAAVEEFEKPAPGRAHARVLDVSRFEDAAGVVDEAERAVGPIDVLIAAAGYGHEGTVEESTMGEWRRQFDVNVFGAVAVIQAVLPGMRRRRSGHIITVTSRARGHRRGVDDGGVAPPHPGQDGLDDGDGAGRGTSSRSPRSAGSSPRPPSASTTAASSPWRASPRRSPPRSPASASV